MKRLAAFAVVLAVASPALACPSDDAIELANRADQTMAVNIDGAIALLTRAIELDPRNARVHYKLARAYLKKEDWKGVAREAGAAAKLAPTFATYHWLEGYALVQQSAWAEAKPALEAAIAADARYADPHVDLATTLERLGDEAGALAHFTAAIRLAPSNVATYAMLANLYVRLGYLDQATAVVREALTWSPQAHARFTLASLAGAIADERGATTDAIARYREAREACGECNERGEAIAFFNLGMALAAGKKPNKAEAAENLQMFTKRVCKGGAAARYADQCTQTQEAMRRLGGP